VTPFVSRGLEEGCLESAGIALDGSPEGMGPTGMCIRTGLPQVMKNISGDPAFKPWRKEALRRGYRSSAALPLIARGKVIGALNIYSGRDDAFSDGEMEILKAISAHVAITMENSMLIEKVMNSKKTWEKTFDSIENPIFIHDGKYRLTRANRAYVEKSGLTYQDALKRPYWEVFPLGEGPLSSCRKTIEDGAGEQTKAERIQTADGEIFLSQAFPIYDESGGASAFVHILNDITSLTEAQKRAEEEAAVSASLLELANSVTGLLDNKAIFEAVLSTVLKLTSAERTAVLLRGKDEEDFRVEMLHGWPDHLTPNINTLRFGKSSSAAAGKILQGETVRVSDGGVGGLVDAKFSEAFGLRSVIFAPVAAANGVLGVVMCEKPGEFTGKDERILKGITSITSTAVDNAMLYRESIDMSADLARKMETIRMTYEVDRAILSSLNRQEILDVTLNNIQRIIPADKMGIVYHDSERGAYLYENETLRPGKCPIIDPVIRAGRIVSVPDLSMYGQSSELTAKMLRQGLLSFMALPLYTKGRRLGCLMMMSRRIGAFDKEDISNAERLTAQMAIALENARLYEDIKDLFLSTVRALSHAVDAKSPWTRGHAERVTRYAIALAREAGLHEAEIEQLELAGLLHDIGKIGTLDKILDKPDELTTEEFELVKKHPGKGAEILGHIKQLKHILPIIKHHHEKLDGTGYPDCLKGDEIPLLSRILCIVDSFDSMTADRPYRPAPGKGYAISELKRCAGTQFDPVLVDAFLKIIG
jgi:PAS domain S-box-containing protein/putative nucleotidyltransferase with HDIG domain